MSARESHGQRLGVKVYGGQLVNSGQILVRQRGTKIHPGVNVMKGKDDTLFAVAAGHVLYHRKGKDRKQVSIVEVEAPVEEAQAPDAEVPDAAE